MYGYGSIDFRLFTKKVTKNLTNTLNECIIIYVRR